MWLGGDTALRSMWVGVELAAVASRREDAVGMGGATSGGVNGVCGL